MHILATDQLIWMNVIQPLSIQDTSDFGCISKHLDNFIPISAGVNSAFASDDDAARSARKLDIDGRMKAMIREVLFYCAFLVLLLIVVNRQQDGNSYLQNNNLIQELTGSSLSNQVGLLLQYYLYDKLDNTMGLNFKSEKVSKCLLARKCQGMLP